MTLPKRDYAGKEAVISMMELRAKPGEVMACAEAGLVIHVEKSGKHIASITPACAIGDFTEIHPDGSITGPVPLTLRRNLGNGGYGS